jgi:muramidase (phage lysozyme)
LKAVGTKVSGYLSKQITAAMQTVVLDNKDSDCGTKGYLTMLLTPDLKNDMMYRYIIENNKLVLINDKNIESYMNREVKLRSPMYCISDKICNKCAGDMYYKLGLKNLGLTATRVSSSLLNLSMKKFHDSTVNTTKVDINKLIV